MCIKRLKSMKKYIKKFLDSGFMHKDLANAKQKALELSRNELLISKEKRDDEEVITCVINHDPGLRKTLNEFFFSHQQVLKRALGDVKLVVSERRHANIASQLFQKRGFSQIHLPTLDSQKCPSRICKTRSTIEQGHYLNAVHEIFYSLSAFQRVYARP